MDKKLETLHDLCETISRELEDVNEKIRKAGGMSTGDLETIDKLSHALKSIKTTVAMMESEDEGGYSGHYMPWYGRSYTSDNRSSYGMSNARGRNNNPMGRNQYSREGGYSYAEDMEATKAEMREMAQKLPEDHRRKIERALDDLR